MHYLKSIKITKDITPFKSGESFEFKDGVNLLVGDQGCGKSTLLGFLMNSQVHHINQEAVMASAKYLTNMGKTVDVPNQVKDLYADHVEVDGDHNVPRVFVDTEQHNPRTMDGDITSRGALGAIYRFASELAQENPSMESKLKEKFAEMANSGANKFAHTDAIIQSRMKSHGQVIFPMLKQISEVKNGIIFLDEPETSLSIRSQFKLAKVIEEAVNNGCQLIIATHSEILMRTVGNVLSMEHRKWMSTEEFLLTQNNHNEN